MRRLFAHAVCGMFLILGMIGCGAVGKKEPVDLKDVPEVVMKAAKENLPDVTFNRAVIKSNGEYELFGKDKKGKVREIDITPEGKVTEIE